jgi:predicted O-methyltransferase YrrM
MGVKVMCKLSVSAMSLIVLVAVRAVSPETSIAAELKYEFTTDWVSYNSEMWIEQLKHLKGKPNVHALEIGSFEGRSAIWFLENILIHPGSSITCVDIFEDKYAYEEKFDRNVEASGFRDKVRKIKGASQKVLRELAWNSYDVIYIDGSHVAKDVLLDAVLSWDLLKTGGILLFDDYEWQVDRYPPWRRPKLAIDAFTQVFEPYIEVLHKEYQLVLRKKENVILDRKLGIVERSFYKTKQILKNWLK